MENQVQKQKNSTDITPYVSVPRAARRVCTPLGKNVIYNTEYYVEEGEEKSRPGQEKDLVVFLKASQASCDILNIVARLQSGDTSVINVKPQGLSGDMVSLPHSVNDINALGDKMSNTFSKLPEEIRKLFHNNPGEFFDAALSGSINDVLKTLNVNKPVEEKPAEEKPAEEVPVEEGN